MSLQLTSRLAMGVQRASGAWSRRLQLRNGSSGREKEPSVQVVCNPQHNYVVCWHPKQPLRYEHTKAISEGMEKEEGVLRQVDLKLLQREKADDEVIAELKALTFTTKHLWYPKREKRTKRDPKAREFL